MIIAVYGLGRLGLPLAVLLQSRGHAVVGVDVNATTVGMILDGESPIVEPGVQDLLDVHRIAATTDPRITRDCDASIIIVPTPSITGGSFDLTMVADAYQDIRAATADRDHLTIVSSTVMPGDCWQLEREFGGSVIYSPEFIALGSVLHDLSNPDMSLIGSNNPTDAQMAERLVCSYVDNGAPVMHTTVANAELSKLALNCYVTMKVAFANAVGMLADAHGADGHEVCRIIGTDSRIGRKYLRPGTPPSGPCFPRDSRAWIAAADDVFVEDASLLARATGRLNDAVIEHLWRRVADEASVAILGLAYKPGTPVTDESAGVQLARAIVDYGDTDLVSHDPLAIVDDVGQVGDAQEAIDQADVVVITIPCPEYRELDYSGKRVVIDPWRLLESE